MLEIENNLIFAFLSMLCFGLTDFSAGLYAKKRGDNQTMILNNVLGFFFILIIILFSKQVSISDISNYPTDIVFKLISIGLFNSLAILFLIKGLSKGNIGLISGIASNFGVVVVILSSLVMQETVSLVGWVFVILTAVGIFFMSQDKLISKVIDGTFYASLAMLFWGLAIFLMIILGREINWIIITFYTFFVGLFISAFLHYNFKIQYVFNKSIILILIFSVIFEILAYLFLNLSSNGHSGIVGAITASYGIIPIVLSSIILREKLAIWQKLGIIASISGLIGLNIYG